MSRALSKIESKQLAATYRYQNYAAFIHIGMLVSSYAGSTFHMKGAVRLNKLA